MSVTRAALDGDLGVALCSPVPGLATACFSSLAELALSLKSSLAFNEAVPSLGRRRNLPPVVGVRGCVQACFTAYV